MQCKATLLLFLLCYLYQVAGMPSISTIATFPPGYFLENIVALPDDSIFITVANRKELYCLPPPAQPGFPRQSFLVETLAQDEWPMGLVSAPNNPNLVYLLTTDFIMKGRQKHYIRMLDVSNVANALHSVVVAEFPAEARGLNGFVALSGSVLLAADSFAGIIWRIDLEMGEGGVPSGANITEWLKDPLFSGQLVLPDFQPGVNGFKYSQKAHIVCFSSTQQRLFGKIAVDEKTLKLVGPVEVLHKGAQGDDLLIDDDHPDGPVAYLTTHRDNSILRIPIIGNDVSNEDSSVVVAQGTAEDPLVLGPTSGAWKRGAEGKTAYIPCDGGLKNALPGEGPRFARVLQIDFSLRESVGKI